MTQTSAQTVLFAGATPANDVYPLKAAQATFNLKCTTTDIYRNRLLQAEGGVNDAVDATGPIATFAAASTPQAGDVVKVVYRCSQ